MLVGEEGKRRESELCPLHPQGPTSGLETNHCHLPPPLGRALRIWPACRPGPVLTCVRTRCQAKCPPPNPPPPRPPVLCSATVPLYAPWGRTPALSLCQGLGRGLTGRHVVSSSG